MISMLMLRSRRSWSWSWEKRNTFQKRLHTLKYKASLLWKHTLCAEVDNHGVCVKTIRNTLLWNIWIEKIIRFLNYERQQPTKKNKQKKETISQERIFGVHIVYIKLTKDTPAKTPNIKKPRTLTHLCKENEREKKSAKWKKIKVIWNWKAKTINYFQLFYLLN